MNKVLVTGAAGFIGSHLSELLTKEGFQVIAYDKYNSLGTFGWLDKSKYKKDIEFALGDIRDFDHINKFIKQCNHIIHLAALISIPYSYLSPSAFIDTNIRGTYNILEASLKSKKFENLISTSTSEIYGSAKYTPIDENHPILGQSPYSASKIGADHLALSYYLSYGLNVNLIRPFNTYGPRQSFRAIIPTITKQALSNNKYFELGNLEPKRDFTYVADTCDAFLKLLKKQKKYGEIYNIGSNSNISNKYLLDMICKKINITKKIKKDNKRVRPSKSEVVELLCDNSKFTKKFNWKPKVGLSEGLDQYIDWFRENKSHYNYLQSYDI